MGIIVRDKQFDKIIFYLKGADVVLSPIVQHNEWLDEECGNMVINYKIKLHLKFYYNSFLKI